MSAITEIPPTLIQNELITLNQSLDAKIPAKKSNNILIATWNIRKFGNLTRDWQPSGKYSPKRDLRGLRCIIDILKRFDVIAVQELTGNLRALRDTMKYLGDTWSFIMTDITAGDAGNNERLAFIFDKSRVNLSGLACEVVIPEKWTDGNNSQSIISRQFARTPYGVSFKAGETTFILLTAHIDYGKSAADRVPELNAIAKWLNDWAVRSTKYHHNFLLLGDFNIDRKDDNLWQAFTSTGLHVPDDLQNVKRSIFIKDGKDPMREKFYDQIAWFKSGSGKNKLKMKYIKGGGFDFVPFVYTDQNLTKSSISHRISDHYPLWAEFERE